MTGLEWNNFEKLNFREYIISENTEYISYYNELKDEGIKSILNFKEIQRLIEKIALFYEFKYPEKMLDDMEHMAIADDQSLYECFQISKRLDIEQLQYRLSHDELQFLECSHGGNLYLHKKKKIGLT